MLYALILTIVVGDPQSGPAYDYVIDYNLTQEDCSGLLTENQDVWLRNDNVGMHCEEQR